MIRRALLLASMSILVVLATSVFCAFKYWTPIIAEAASGAVTPIIPPRHATTRAGQRVWRRYAPSHWTPEGLELVESTRVATTRVLNSDGRFEFVYYFAVGYPWRCLEGAEIVGSTRELVHLIEFRDAHGGLRLLLPWRPMMGGFLGNFCIVFVLLAIPVEFGRFVHRRRRIARGLCVRCKYPVAGDRCPECGHGVRS